MVNIDRLCPGCMNDNGGEKICSICGYDQSASNENYRIIEQRNIALSYAMQTIEALQLEESSISIDEIKNKAKIENNMDITIDIENLPPKNGKDYGDKIQIITANVSYHIKSSDAGSLKNLTLQTLKIND